MLYIGTNVELTMKLKIHWKATATATAAPRMLFGNISAMSTQQIGPHENMKHALYTMMLTTGTTGGTATRLLRATPAAPTAIPIEPHMSRGLRPRRSTVNTATSVNEMLTMPIITVCIIGSPMFMDSKIRGA